MRFTSCIRMCLICAALLVATLAPGSAKADECAANVEHITFAGTTSPLQLVFFDTILECVDLVIDDFTFGNAFPMTIELDDQKMGMRSDALVMFNDTNGPNGRNVANLCLWSNEAANGASDCTNKPKVSQMVFVKEPESFKFQLVPGTWYITFTSGTAAQGNTACVPFGDKCSDVGVLATPEPDTLGLLVMGLLGFAGCARRRILGKDV